MTTLRTSVRFYLAAGFYETNNKHPLYNSPTIFELSTLTTEHLYTLPTITEPPTMFACLFVCPSDRHTHPQKKVITIPHSPFGGSVIIKVVHNFTIFPKGGIKAVVYTDVLQFLLMFIGPTVVVIIIVMDVGGVAKVWNIGEQGGRLEFFKLVIYHLIIQGSAMFEARTAIYSEIQKM